MSILLSLVLQVILFVSIFLYTGSTYDLYFWQRYNIGDEGGNSMYVPLIIQIVCTHAAVLSYVLYRDIQMAATCA